MVFQGNLNIQENFRPEVGRSLCYYNDPGYGKMIKEDKYSNYRIRDELIEGCKYLVNNWAEIKEYDFKIVYIPSIKRPNFVKDFAEKLALKLSVDCINALIRTDFGSEQKECINSEHQMENSIKNYGISDKFRIESAILLVDDIIDSRWTITYCTYLLRTHGAKKVFPLTIANAGGKDVI